LQEVLDHGRTALLFDPKMPGALWHAVLQLAGDAGLRDRLGAAAREEILHQDLTWSGNARRVAELAETLLRRRSTAPASMAASIRPSS
jgi:glycosyltransferase involved in cell wall biosynthesis